MSETPSFASEPERVTSQFLEQIADSERAGPYQDSLSLLLQNSLQKLLGDSLTDDWLEDIAGGAVPPPWHPPTHEL